MFERFTDRARRVIVLAQDEARELQHGVIRPEHLLLGLVKGDGVASTALRDEGITYEEVRQKVVGTVKAVAGSEKLNKVPFSGQAKKALELALREALSLGHNYIGTEHLLLGLLKGPESGENQVKAVLGEASSHLRGRVISLLPRLGPSERLHSPAASEALDRARQLAGRAPLTTVHLLSAIVADPRSHGAQALAHMGVDEGSLAAAVAQVPVEGSSDDQPGTDLVQLKVGGRATTIGGPELVALLKGLTPEQIREGLRRAFGSAPEDASNVRLQPTREGTEADEVRKGGEAAAS